MRQAYLGRMWRMTRILAGTISSFSLTSSPMRTRTAPQGQAFSDSGRSWSISTQGRSAGIGRRPRLPRVWAGVQAFFEGLGRLLFHGLLGLVEQGELLLLAGTGLFLGLRAAPDQVQEPDALLKLGNMLLLISLASRPCRREGFSVWRGRQEAN